MSDVLFSIVIPAYNREKFIVKTKSNIGHSPMVIESLICLNQLPIISNKYT